MQLNSIQNFQTYDAFRDQDDDGAGGVTQDNFIHLRIQKRTGKKTLTTIEGLSEKLALKKLVSAWKKLYSCNGAIKNDEELGLVVQLTGDQRLSISKFLIEEGIATKDQIKMHGF